ncbi:hypothetical protein PR048_031050 [Dryococelus australis]|uniref:Uncharacterized protein n=1 Tax=Dryococelus australis TaxID=614101 RepID=A0ABQ9G710_9NEOP|nr:hypothetical protein PR048_031050 [Dryococelus australis]
MNMEQRRNTRAGETGDPRGNPPISGIVWSDTIPTRKNQGATSPGIELCSPWWEESSLTTTPPRPHCNRSTSCLVCALEENLTASALGNEVLSSLAAHQLSSRALFDEVLSSLAAHQLSSRALFDEVLSSLAAHQLSSRALFDEVLSSLAAHQLSSRALFDEVLSSLAAHQLSSRALFDEELAAAGRKAINYVGRNSRPHPLSPSPRQRLMGEVCDGVTHTPSSLLGRSGQGTTFPSFTWINLARDDEDGAASSGRLLLACSVDVGASDKASLPPLSASSRPHRGLVIAESPMYTQHKENTAGQFRGGRSGVVARSLACHQGEPCSIPDGVAPGYSHVGFFPDDAVRRGVLLGDIPFSSPFYCSAAPFPPRFTVIGSKDLDVKSRPYLSTPSLTPYSHHFVLIASQDFVVKNRLHLTTPGMRKEMGDPRVNLWTSGNFRHDSHVQKSWSVSAQNRPRAISMRGELRRAAHRLHNSPLIEIARGRFWAETLQDFCTWESCRRLPLVHRFTRGSPISFLLCIPALLHSHLASAPIGSQDPAQTCPRHSKHLVSVLSLLKTSRAVN